MVEDVGVALGGILQILNIFLCVDDAAGVQIGGDLVPAHPQVIFGNHNKNALDMPGHEPGRERASADQDQPYILPLLQCQNLLA